MANNYNTFVFKNKVYGDISVSLDKNYRELVNYITKYFDRHSDVLFDKSIHQLYFGINGNTQDVDIIYKVINKSPEEIEKYIKESGQTDSHWVLFNKPINWALVNIIRYFYLNDKPKELELVVIYFACSYYASIFFKYFKGYPINEAVMDYTINNLSNRYDIKRLGSLFKVLQKISMKCHDTYKEYLDEKDFCDRHIVEYMQNLHTRINNFVQELKNQYQKNKDSGKYMNYEKDDTSEENFHENDNISYSIERYANKITNTILTCGPNQRLAESAAKITSVSVFAIKDAVTKIIEKETEEIREFITLYLQQYLIVEGHSVQSISSKNYLNYANKIYAKSNTTDKGILRIKELLDKWLVENSEKYVKTERAATKTNFRKAIFLYFALSVQAVIVNKY